jgi:lysophospholipase L1-like esterase
VVVAVALLAAGSVVAALGAAELTLRSRHFQFRAIPDLQFGWPEPQVIANEFQQDRDLLWVTHDYHEKLTHAKTTHANVIFLGDSCVEFSTYPRRTLSRLAKTDPALGSGEKLGVPGWSSEQGRTQMLRDVLPLHPRVVTIEFGWNDHWDALGPPDDETHPGRLLMWASEHLRVYQAYRKAYLGLEQKWHPEGPRRVSLDRYRDNLRTMAEAATREGARVVLITAPTDHVAGAEPEYLHARHLHQLSQLIPLHASYVQATRDVARATGASLCDAAAAMATLANRRLYFRPDGIHFNEWGDTFMGDFVAGCIESAIH